MTSDATYAVIESLKIINSSMEKVTSRIEILENDYKERYLKKRFFRWLVAIYPIVLVFLLFVIDLDHKKIAEISGDIKELIKDASSLTIIHEQYGERE